MTVKATIKEAVKQARDDGRDSRLRANDHTLDLVCEALGLDTVESAELKETKTVADIETLLTKVLVPDDD